MLLYVKLSSVLFSISVASSVNRSSKSIVQSKGDALIYLNKFGYNPCNDSIGVLCSVSLSRILKQFQKRFRLPITGIFDEATKKQMNRPRCGNKDLLVTSSKKSPKALIQQWRRSSLTWSLRNYSPRIDQAQTQIIIQRAFDVWFKHIPLTIKQVCPTCSADMTIEFGSGYHSDPYPFDGLGGTLAHAYFPQDGRIHFDADEPWTTSYNGDNINFFLVAVHEIGHALGLEHVYEKFSIMFPSYQLFKEKDLLPHYDRFSIQQIYGSALTTTTSRTTKRTTLSKLTTKPTTLSKLTTKRTTLSELTTKRTTLSRLTTKITKATTRIPVRVTTMTTASTKTTTSLTTTFSSKIKYFCGLFIDAAFDFPDNSFHMLDTGMLRRYLPNKESWDKRTVPLQRIYQRLPKRIVGGTYDFSRNEILIFGSTRVYRYRVNTRSYKVEYRRDDILPEHLEGRIVGAIFYQDGVYVINSKTLQPFDVENLKGKTTARKLKDQFPGFSGSVKTAFTSGYLHHFFTSDRLVYVWNEQFNSWKTFGKPMNTNWFACLKTRRKSNKK